MKIGVAGSVGIDHLMVFSGKFTDSLVEGSLEKVSLSFLVDSMDVRRGGCAANIAFGMGVLGLNPILIAAVGKDWADYDSWLWQPGSRARAQSQGQRLQRGRRLAPERGELGKSES